MADNPFVSRVKHRRAGSIKGPEVRIRFPPAVRRLRTRLVPPEGPTARIRLPPAASHFANLIPRPERITGDRGFESGFLQRRVFNSMTWRPLGHNHLLRPRGSSAPRVFEAALPDRRASFSSSVSSMPTPFVGTGQQRPATIGAIFCRERRNRALVRTGAVQDCAG
jgi:hypothetical protein